MRVFELPDAAPREQGRAHGEELRELIVRIADIRTRLTVDKGRFADRDAVLAAAREHLPVLERWNPELHQELLGIADGSGVSAAELVVVNHYTDLRDLDPDVRDFALAVRDHPGDEECSAVWARTPVGGVLGQTWDMHGSAQDYVMMLGVPARGAHPAAWTLSITGCLGMTGLNDRGLGVTINNLRSTDARIGVLWPALVRRVLQESAAEAGRDVVLNAPLGSGHHYLVATDAAAYGVETSGNHQRVVFRSQDDDAYVHTNHCLHADIEAHSEVAPGSTTHERYAALTVSLARRALAGPEDLWERLGSHEGFPRSVCTHVATAEDPHAMLTCGAVVMDLARKALRATRGCVHRARALEFQL